jgi:hypothetical protein
MFTTSSYKVLAGWQGFCAACPVERPLVLLEHGQHGLQAWWNGVGPEARPLSYCCTVCGLTERVPATEIEDREYDATLARWPDLSLDLTEIATGVLTVPAPRRHQVTVVRLPVQRVAATDVGLLAAA